MHKGWFTYGQEATATQQTICLQIAIADCLKDCGTVGRISCNRSQPQRNSCSTRRSDTENLTTEAKVPAQVSLNRRKKVASLSKAGCNTARLRSGLRRASKGMRAERDAQTWHSTARHSKDKPSGFGLSRVPQADWAVRYD